MKTLIHCNGCTIEFNAAMSQWIVRLQSGRCIGRRDTLDEAKTLAERFVK